MNREWFLIDDEGIHPLDMTKEPENFWDRFDGGVDDAPWPPFNQVAVDASPAKTVEALHNTAPGLGVDLEDVSTLPERWAGGIVVAEAGALTVVGEPGVDLEERVMALRWTEALLGELGCDGAFFGYDPEAGTLHLTVFSDGRAEFAWCDSLRPGPSYAMVFDDEGKCREEDPRRFALRMLEMPETSPLLDRYRFVWSNLERLGLDVVSPEMEEFPIAAVIGSQVVRQMGQGDS